MRNAFLFCLLLICPALIAQEMMTNDSVVKLIKAGLSEDLVVTTINSSPGKYDTSTSALIALKKAGAGDKVVAAIILKTTGASAAPAAPTPEPAASTANPSTPLGMAPGALPPGVDTIGVYYHDSSSNTWQEVPAEVVNFKSEGALKHYASAGVLKGEKTALIGGNRSSLPLKLPASFILYVPEGRAPGEYQLIRMHVNADSREFRAANGGIVHDAGGALRDVIDYVPKKIAPRIYLIEMGEDTENGEYGFLPPSDTAIGSNIPTATKIYSFSLSH